ncbi:putative pox1-acyl-CoA oxidase [Meira miltonrushii]|uniref:Acyl-coenzyme A oxidase n=1 Tax=Meira miltonrushii TaxID=1280837 RepID=A0A316V6C0_9BASI|nr:putative pox1-acyl-CoA oxidase [Meira miltonrushii]PWN32021.1 putative pox1-acyl-CoA oxidase [Meira miltonrushii]
MTSGWNNTETMATMAKERENPPFDIRAMAIAHHGSKRDLELKEKFMLEISRDPAYYAVDIHDLTKDQTRQRTMAKIGSLVHCVTNESIEIFQKRMEVIGLFDPGFWTRFGVHYGLFVGAIRSAATPNQFSYWLEKGVIGCKGMFGCFCMTELGHGSNVAGLLTTATLDLNTDEWIIHTPDLLATKWWIGGAAESATHGAVFAQMIIKGKRHGVKTFIVPLRDPKTFQLLPGINIGDIGMKMGRNGIDNGYVQFTNVRVPRAYMLMKHTQVTRDGEVFEPPLAQLTYGALLQGRTAMVADAANSAKKALTIGVRYAAVRRQFKSSPDAERETQLLDYPIHQRRLMPLLCQSVAFGFTALQMTNLFEETSRALESLEPGDPNLQATIELLKETHSTSAGLKAFCTWATLEAIEKTRQACGGHGYSSYVGLAPMGQDFAVHCTWEGDNTILALQSGRALVQAYQEARKGKEMGAGMAYMNNLDKSLKAKASEQDLDSLEGIDQGWACVAAHAVKKATEDYEGLLKSGKSRDQAFEACSQSRFVAASVHTSGYIYRQFRAAVERVEKSDDGVREHLELLAKFYGLWQMEEKAAFFLRSGWLSTDLLDKVQERVTDYCAETRKFAIPLVDSFVLHDHTINSPFAKYDGSVYTSLFRAVKRNNPQGGPHKYLDTVKGLLFREDAELEDVDEAIGIDDEIQEIQEERAEAEKEQNEQKEAGVTKEAAEPDGKNKE